MSVASGVGAAWAGFGSAISIHVDDTPTADLLALREQLLKYDESEPRDEAGRWTSGDAFEAYRQAQPDTEVGKFLERYGRPAAVGPLLRQLSTLQGQFPYVQIEMVEIQRPGTGLFGGADGEKLVAAYNPGYRSGDILLNGQYWATYGQGDLGVFQREGWTAVPTTEGMLTHEFGHAVDAQLTRLGLQGDAFGKSWMAWRDAVSARYDGSEPDPWHQISGYGRMGIFKEALAEVFSLAYTPGQDEARWTDAQRSCVAELRGALGTQSTHKAAKSRTYAVALDLKKYDPAENRDEQGRWSVSGESPISVTRVKGKWQVTWGTERVATYDTREAANLRADREHAYYLRLKEQATGKAAKSRTYSSGGTLRDDHLDPIIGRVKEQLVALLAEHANQEDR